MLHRSVTTLFSTGSDRVCVCVLSKNLTYAQIDGLANTRTVRQAETTLQLFLDHSWFFEHKGNTVHNIFEFYL